MSGQAGGAAQRLPRELPGLSGPRRVRGSRRSRAEGGDQPKPGTPRLRRPRNEGRPIPQPRSQSRWRGGTGRADPRPSGTARGYPGHSCVPSAPGSPPPRPGRPSPPPASSRRSPAPARPAAASGPALSALPPLPPGSAAAALPQLLLSRRFRAMAAAAGGSVRAPSRAASGGAAAAAAARGGRGSRRRRQQQHPRPPLGAAPRHGPARPGPPGHPPTAPAGPPRHRRSGCAQPHPRGC